MSEKPAVEFPQYATSYSKGARDCRAALAPELLPTLAAIESALAEDPEQFPDRVVPASRDGTVCIYRHPDPKIEITYEVDRERMVIYYFHFSAPSFDVKKTIFISYSHEDQEWLDRIRKFLSVLEQEGVISFWDDSRIDAGEDWQEEVRCALEAAGAAILLVSQDFLTSRFIQEFELPRVLADARNEGKKVFWIPLKHSTVSDTEIARYQALVSPAKPLEELEGPELNKTLVEICQKLREVA